MIVHVAETFRPFAEQALTRLRYLYPGANFILTADGIEISGEASPAESVLCREVNYTLYREKIYADTLSMRRGLLEAVSKR